MTKTELLVIDEITKLLRDLGAPLHIISVISSIDDTLDADDVLKILHLHNNGFQPTIIDKSSFN